VQAERKSKIYFGFVEAQPNSEDNAATPQRHLNGVEKRKKTKKCGFIF
jgi:hypothetical protein